MRSYDILVIGSGPGGEKAAVQAAKFGKKVAVIERSPFIGGAGIHTGTLPSKTLREAAIFISGLKQRAVFGHYFLPGRDVTLGELMYKKSEVIRRQMEVIIDHFGRNNIEVVYGEASFVDAHTLAVRRGGGESERLRGEIIVIATGTRPARPPEVPFDSTHIYDSDTILELDRLPASIAVVGGGVIGCEYACIFASLGVKVTLIDKRERLLGFVDAELVTSLLYWMRHMGITVRGGEQVTGITVEGKGRVVTRLASGKIVVTEKLLYTMGRVGNTDRLNLEAVGLEADDRGLLKVDSAYRTAVPNIYAVGDVIGFPSLASTSREQGRIAVCHAVEDHGEACALPSLLPYGIYTIPEISMVGETEQTLTEKGVPYESGTALFQEVARGQIIGDVHGMLKLLFHRETLRLLGVHIVGERASELIHIGQAVMSFGGTVEYFRDVVFNYPTLSDAYKQAALNGLNRLGGKPCHDEG
ncbi:MAG TPA: Si-specific NAD(P)(+) transhydrogenase [Deltaproteobacteria bacterium]|nr:Si-specific NAD(P)(+) transhydrogenase [Deltaproteobacteria bacterium]